MPQVGLSEIAIWVAVIIATVILFGLALAAAMRVARR